MFVIWNTEPVSDAFSDAEPRLEDFLSILDFARAFDAFHDRRAPTHPEKLDRAVRLASESMRGIEIQLRRILGAEPEDRVWLSRVVTDFQFLIFCLWKLRLAARSVGDAEEVQKATNEFDRQLPDLAVMRHVMQHIDEYAVDGSKRRQRRPNSEQLVGRRALEVASWDDQKFWWLGGTVEYSAARAAASQLYAALRTTRDNANAGRNGKEKTPGDDGGADISPVR